MDIFDKLKILADAAKYDVSCSSSGSSRKNSSGIGNASISGICHSFTADGRCISLLKILLTNHCIYDCVYCVNRMSNDIPRAAFTPDEIAEITINFYKRNYIEGLFLSSAIYKNPNYTMELLTETVSKLRNKFNFNGYIHLKAIPGADMSLINKAGKLVDRMSVNMELPSSSSLKLLAPQKNKEIILKPMEYITKCIKENKYELKKYKNTTSFVPAGQSTQLIIGATSDEDYRIIKLSEHMYNTYNLKRVYYSAYVPVNINSKLPSINTPPLIREHRLYQADWLLRFYGFKAEELLDRNNPNFDLNYDPKTNWALNNLHKFPVEINTAPYELLLRIPGIGVTCAKRIYSIRKVNSISFYHLKKIGVVLKRAQYFITCNGKYYGDTYFRKDYIKTRLTPKKDLNILENIKYEQLSFFHSNALALYEKNDIFSRITGEL